MGNRRWLLAIWGMTVAAIGLFLLVPSISLASENVKFFFKNDWVHFALFIFVVSVPCVLARSRKHLMWGIAVASVLAAAEAVHGAFIEAKQVLDVFGADLFGIVAGILLGLNLRMLNSASVSAADRQQEDQHAMQ